MKTLNKLFATGAMVFLLMLMAPHKSMAQDDGYVSDQQFYDELQQYGTWVQDDQYGDVWVPDVDDNFRPYATDGYWVQTDYGTTWVSDYPWGWATFHYGRWRYDDYYGWEWIPGHEWAPAWVSWRQGGGYYGWAPMGPGLSVTLSLGGGGYTDNNYWVYAPQRYITSRYISRYYAPRTQVNVIIRNTTYIHNTYVYNKRTYITGPRPADIQRITRRKVTVYKINDAPKPGGFHVGVNVINIYRPAIKKTPDARPVRVVSATAYKNEHPTEGIGKKGAVGYNHGNAGKLASAARANNPDGKVVRVNPKKEEPNGPNKPNVPAVNNPAIPAGGHRTNEPKVNPSGQPVEQKGDRGNHKNAPVTQPAQGGGQQPQPAANKPAGPQGNALAQPAAGRGHHKTAPCAAQPAQGAAQPQPQVNKPAEPQGNIPAQPEQGSQPGRHQHKQAPAVIPPAQNNTDQAKKEEQQQQAQQQKQQQQQEQQAARQQAAQQQKQEQQQAQQTARQQVQQQKQQQQQAQQAARQQAAQQQRQQQQQAQQAARQQAQQQKQQQQQAQQAARQQAQQAAQQARQQAAQQKQQQEEQQKQQQQNPPRN